MLKIRPLLKEIQPYQPGRRASEVKRELGLEELIKLSSNESPLPPPKLAQKAMRLAISGINRYPDGNCRLLADKLCRIYSLPLENLIVGNGSNELLRLFVQVIIEPGDEIVMAKPSFVVYPLVAKIMQAKMVEVPLKEDFSHDLSAMADVVTAKTKILFICNPNNPTGTIVRRREIEELMGRVPPEVAVAFDEAYFEYADDPDFLSGMELFEKYPNVVVFRTFSKIYGMAGIRIGYAVAPEEVVAAMNKVREPFNVNMIAQVGAYYSLDCGAEIAGRKKTNMSERQMLEADFNRLGITYAASQTNFIYADLGKDANRAFTDLQQLGIIVRAFGNGNYVRITVGSPSENRKLVAALEALGRKA